MTTREFIGNFKSTHGRLPSQVEISKQLKLSPQAAVQSLIQYIKEPAKEQEKTVVKPVNIKRINTVVILKIILFMLSAMAFTLSVYFTGLWFSDKFHIVISGLISLTMVLFMVISPQVLRYVDNRSVKVVVYISFSIALLFSMGSTVAGQFNAVTKRIENEPDKAYIFNQLLANEEEVQKLIEEAQKDKVIHQSTISLLSSTEENRLKNWQSIATERKYIAVFDERIDGLREELKSVRNNKVDNGIIEEKRDFYLFISGLTGVEKSMIEFIISSLPALFIDIISALCLNLALYIGKEAE